MDYRKFGNQIVLRVDRDEEVMTEITALCEKENVHLASISGLGAADHLVMGLYDVEAQKFTETVLPFRCTRRPQVWAEAKRWFPPTLPCPWSLAPES